MRRRQAVPYLRLRTTACVYPLVNDADFEALKEALAEQGFTLGGVLDDLIIQW